MQHCGTAQCATNKNLNLNHDSLKKAKENAKKWFQPCVYVVPLTVSTPAFVTPVPLPSSSTSLFTPPIPPHTLSGCPIGITLLCKFHVHIEALPHDVGDADEYHPLVQFAGDPMGCIEENEDAWERFHGPLNMLLQKPQDELKHLVLSR